MKSHQKRMFGKIDWDRVKCDQEFVNFYGEDESKLCIPFRSKIEYPLSIT